MTPDDLASATQNPILVYVAIALAAGSMITSAFPRLLGPIGKALMDWSKARREARIAEEDFRIKDLREERDYLAVKVTRATAREYRWSIEANRARVWMRRALGLLTDHDIPIDPYPDLMTPDPPDDPTRETKENTTS